MSFRTAYGYARSENGWRMCNRDECDIVRIPGLSLVDTAPLRRGAPLVILGAWLRWYDQNVEEIATSVWGWSATNDVPNSNHLAGCAVDVNAPRYPWGARTMPRERIGRVRRGLGLFEGFVFWGADWGRADQMHYQLTYPEGHRGQDAFARKLLDGHLGIYGRPKPAPAPRTTPTEGPRIDTRTGQPPPLHRRSTRPLGTVGAQRQGRTAHHRGRPGRGAPRRGRTAEVTEFAAWAALVLSVINTLVILHTRAWVARWADNLRRLL